MPFKPTSLDHKRIRIMGDTLMQAPPGSKAACVVDADGADAKYTGKGDWYEKQFREKYPRLIIVKRGDGPAAGMHSIILETPPFRRRGHSDN